MFRNVTRSLVVLAATLTLSACDSPTTLDPEREMAALAGEYGAGGQFGAISFTVAGSGTIDVLALGGTVQLELTADGKTTGRLFVPDGGEHGGDMDEDLAGTWALVAGEIRFDHEADTFIRDMPFRVEGTRLVGEKTFGDEAVRVELARR